MLDDDNPAEGPAGIFRAVGELYNNMIDSMKALEGRIVSLEMQNQKLEERLGLLLAERTQDRMDLHSESHIIHLGLAAEYHTLVVQWMQRVARKLVAVQAGADFELALGQQVSGFTEHLFRGKESNVKALMSSLGEIDPKSRQLAQSMCDRATSLRAKIAEIGIPHEWDFRTEISGTLDDERQEAWLTCDPNLPVRLVVAPAYVVQGQFYAKQLVVTDSSSLVKLGHMCIAIGPSASPIADLSRGRPAPIGQ
jgi:hypothetical protein